MEKYNKIAIAALFVIGSMVAKASNTLTNDKPAGFDTATCKEQQFTKSYNKTFNVTPKQLVVLANKYGKVDVKTGTGNQVVVNVKITVETSSDRSEERRVGKEC